MQSRRRGDAALPCQQLQTAGAKIPGVISRRCVRKADTGCGGNVSSFEVIALEPDHPILKITSTSGSFSMTVTRITEPLQIGTNVIANVMGHTSGFFKPAGPLLARLVQRSVSEDHVNLKRLLEADDGHRV